MTRFDKLFVIWRRPPGDGTRHVVGELGGPGPFWFRYADDLSDARRNGFGGFPEFPVDAVRYESRTLFATFRSRIPSAKRPDFPRLMTAWGVEDQSDPLEILARSGGFLLTDRIELAEYRGPDDDLRQPLEFRVAGQKYHQDPEATLPLGTELVLKREPTNLHDPHAVELLSARGRIGYVPRQYSWLFSRLLSAGVALSARTQRALLVPGEARRWVVTAWAT